MVVYVKRTFAIETNKNIIFLQKAPLTSPLPLVWWYHNNHNQRAYHHHITTISSNMARPLNVRVIPNDKLFVSTPNPISFGNVDNPPVQDPNWTHENWLQTRFHFSFADYDNPDNM